MEAQIETAREAAPPRKPKPSQALVSSKAVKVEPEVYIPTLPELAAAINEDHLACNAAAQTCLERALACGFKLVEAKARCGHGQWLPFLTTQCPNISERTAQRYMKLTKVEPSTESDTLADLSISAFLQLVPTVSEPANPEGEDLDTDKKSDADVASRIFATFRDMPEEVRHLSGRDLCHCEDKAKALLEWMRRAGRSPKT